MSENTANFVCGCGRRIIFLVATAMSFGLFAAAKTCIWEGGVDGNWSTPGNWKDGVVPAASGDTVVIRGGEQSINVNPEGGVKVVKIFFEGTGPVELTGNQLSITHCDAGSWPAPLAVSNTVPVSFNVPVVFAQTKTSKVGWYYLAPVDFYKPVTFANSNRLDFRTDDSTREVCFHDTVTALNGGRIADAASPGMTVRFYGATALKNVELGNYGVGNAYFYSSDNLFDYLTVSYKAELVAMSENVFSETAYLTQISGRAQKDSGSLNLGNFNQTMNRIRGLVAPKAGPCLSIRSYVGTSYKPVTLTLKGTDDAYTTFALWDKVSIVWNPTNDFCQVFSNRVHDTTGTLTVKGGTLVSAGTSSFPKVTAIICDGGAFENDTTATDSLGGLEKLQVSATGVFRVTDRCVAKPFGNARPELILEKGAVLEIPENITLQVGKAFFADRYPKNAVYTGKGYGVEGVTIETDHIVGPGRLEVTGNADITSWINPEGGNWNDVANWTAGVPATGKSAYVGLDTDDPITLALSADVTLPDNLTLEGKNVRFAVPVGVTATLDGSGRGTCAYTVRNGAEFRVDGGAVVFTNYVGTFEVSGTANATGRVAVASGEFVWAPDHISESVSYTMDVMENGEIAVSGGMFTSLGAAGATATQVKMCGGRMFCSGTGTFNSSNIHRMFGSGEYLFSGDAVYTKTAAVNLHVCPQNEGEALKVTFRDRARITGNCNQFLVYGNKGCETVFTIDSTGAFAKFNYRFGVGMDDGTAVFNLVRGDIAVGNRGFDIGSSGGKRSSSGVKGVANLSSGSVSVTGGWNDNKKAAGVLVGYGVQTTETEGRPYEGVLNIANCAVTNSAGSTLIGSGLATGILTQIGGAFVHESTSKIAAIGVAGGIGCVAVSNGLFSVANDLYVGGAFTNSFPNGLDYVGQGWSLDRHDAEGAFIFAGGTFSAAKNVILGADGHGTFERFGAKGTCTVKNLILSNAIENVTAGGTLKFVTDQGLVAPVNVTGRLFLGAGAELVVDVGNVKPAKSQRLVTAKTVEGEFAAVRVVGPAAADVKVTHVSGGYKLSPVCGLLLIVR